MGRSYLSLLEECRPPEVCSRYALIYRHGKPQGAVAAQILTVTGDRVLGQGKPKKPNLLHQALSPAARKVSAAMKERVLVCGNLFSWGCHGAAFAPGAAPGDLWPAVAEALYRIRRAERLSGETNLVFIKELSARHQQTAHGSRRLT